MGLRVPQFMLYALMGFTYPFLYIGWVSLITNLWIDNDLKEMHPEILQSTAGRFTTASSPYDYRREMEESLIAEGHGLREEYLSRIEKQKKLLSHLQARHYPHSLP